MFLSPFYFFLVARTTILNLKIYGMQKTGHQPMRNFMLYISTGYQEPNSEDDFHTYFIYLDML